MTQRQLGILTIVVVAVLVAGSVLYYALKPPKSVQNASQAPIVSKAALGQPAPEFAVSTTHGLFDLKTVNQPVFLEIFATWCPHCQRETAVVDRLYAAYGKRVAFVGVSGSATAMDGNSPASQLDVIEWVSRFHVSYPVAYDPTLAVANLYLQGGFPTFVVIGNDKRIAYVNSGEIPYAELATAIGRVLSGRH
jgi:cytochrome c biogenesis protein CcmG, thiol:disulfide interchange protein DsbE